MNLTSIDDVLTGTKTNIHPSTPEMANEPLDDIDDTPTPEIEASESTNDYEVENEQTSSEEAEEPKPESRNNLDEYGNEQGEEKLYTKEEVDARINEVVRERLARGERNAPTQQQVQQAKQGFEYDADSNETWQQQLESFVENTVSKMSQKQSQQAEIAREQQAQAAFEDKFNAGMGKFKDFVQVVQAQPITDAMVLASRGLADPAAFFYAVAKRSPQELQRISQLPDKYAQMVEIGKLEERMRKSKPATSAPKPLGRSIEDSTVKQVEKREHTIEDLIAASDAKRKNLRASRRR